MPLATPNSNRVNLDFQARVDDLIAESNRVIAKIEEVKQETKESNAALLKQAQEADRAAQSNTMSWTDFRSMYQTVLDVVRAGQAVWDETGQKFVNYALEVGQAARTLGTTTEEASRLIQVADDVGISFDSLKMSMKLASKDGFSPTVEGLAAMSDEYLKLQPGVERTQFLLDRFGRSGDEMAKIMEKGGDSIRTMSAAIEDNLVITELGYKQAEQYRIAQDQLNDAWDGLTIQLGQKAAPVMTDVYVGMKNNIAAGVQWKDALRAIPLVNFIRGVQDLKKAHAANTAALQEATDASEEAGGVFETEAEKTARLAEEARLAAKAMQDLQQANAENIKQARQLTEINGDYADSQADIRKQQNELQGQIDALIAQGWSPLSDKVRGLQEDYDKLGEKYNENATAHQARLMTILTDMTLEKIAMQDGVAGFSEAEAAKALAVAETTGVVDAEAIKQQVAFDQVSTAIANGTVKVEDFKRLLEEMTKHNWTIDVALNMINRGYAGYGNGLSYATGDLKHQNQHAMGGSFLIPMSYGNEGFRMGNGDTASGGESVTITPRGQSGMDTMNIYSMIMAQMPTERGIARALAAELDMRGIARR